MKRFIWATYIGVVCALFAAEAAYFLDPLSPWRRCAGFFWLSCTAVIIVSTWGFAFLLFLQRDFWALRHKGWYLVAFVVPPLLILVDVGGTRFTPVDGEGLAQLAGGLALLRWDTSLGIFSLSYYGYMARQYVLNAMPSYVFGPSLVTARIGNSMFYIGSYLFFLSALVSYLRSRKKSEPLLLTGFCGVVIALGQYALLNARKFEQTTMPIAVTLFFLGALMLFLVEPQPLRFLWVMWAFGFCTGCYTPAIGTWVLAFAILLYLIVWRRRSILVPVAAYGCVCLYIAYRVLNDGIGGAISYKFRFGIGHGTTVDWAFRYLNSMRAVIGSDYTLIQAPMALSVFAAVCLAWRYRERRFLAICAWAVAIVAVSVTTFGSNLNIPYYDIHRALIILPPLALGAILLISRLMSDAEEEPAEARILRGMMKLSIVYMVFTGVCTAFLVRSFLGSPIRSDYDEVFERIDELATSRSAVPPTRIFLVPPLDVLLEPGLQYFAPGAMVVRAPPPAGEKIPGTYIFSYLTDDPRDRIVNQHMPSIHTRPFVRMVTE